MYDGKYFLYETCEKDEIEKITDEIVEANAKDEASNLEEKLAASKELELFYQKKLDDVAPFIIELKERSGELDELKKEVEEKSKKSELEPKNQALKEEALEVIEEYSEILDDMVTRIEKKIRAGLTKLLEDQQYDHKVLFDTLKEYRSQLKEGKNEQKEQREKILALIEQEIQDKVDSKLGKEFSEILLKEVNTYPEAMQNELKKHRLEKTEEVLLALKTLTDVYGYEKTGLTPEFIEKEMENLKSKIKLYLPEYKSTSAKLKDLSYSKLSIVKIKMLKEVKEELLEKVEELNAKKKELETTLDDDKKMLEILDLEDKKDQISEEIKDLEEERELVYNLANGVENEEQAQNLDNIIKNIEEKEAQLSEIEAKLKELNKAPEQEMQINGLEALAQLLSGVYPQKNEEKEDVEMEDAEALEGELEEDVEMEEPEFMEYEPLTEEEKAEMNEEIANIDKELNELQEKADKLQGIIESKDEVSEKYDDLAEKQKEGIEKINDDISKYKLFKDLTDAIERSRDISYQGLYI